MMYILRCACRDVCRYIACIPITSCDYVYVMIATNSKITEMQTYVFSLSSNKVRVNNHIVLINKMDRYLYFLPQFFLFHAE